jgi:hypothetical protein
MVFNPLQEMDVNKDGWITPSEFREKMEQFKNYTAYVHRVEMILVAIRIRQLGV